MGGRGTKNAKLIGIQYQEKGPRTQIGIQYRRTDLITWFNVCVLRLSTQIANLVIALAAGGMDY